jgi:hypothetical protein
MRVEMELRNLPREHIIEYLIAAGGSTDGSLTVIGEGWRALLQEMEPAHVGSFLIPRDLLIIEGSDSVVPPIHQIMKAKTMRGGG